ncbi:hypothetical protein BKA70DRAFT_1226643 [Coprinopsis sp. MPI-PUGE-AT-0042]|nr:hypothetical protein BKA70DRAFT_1226643 [Coprinopsis sp. MPI-PUGE-AT-0042]
MLLSSSKALTLASALLVLPALTGAAFVPRSSNTQGCSWTCPRQDATGTPLTETLPSTGRVLGCRYTQRKCYYDTIKGTAVPPFIEGCPGKLVEVCTARLDDEDLYKAEQEQREDQVAMQAPTEM